MNSVNPLSAVILLLSTMLFGTYISACKTTGEKINPKFWKGQSRSGSIVRVQSGEIISTRDKIFDRYFCLDEKSLVDLYTACLDAHERDD